MVPARRERDLSGRVTAPSPATVHPAPRPADAVTG